LLLTPTLSVSCWLP